LYKVFDGQAICACDGLFAGQRVKCLEGVVTELLFHKKYKSRVLLCDERPHGTFIPMTELLGLHRYFYLAETGEVWLASGFNVFLQAPSLPDFLRMFTGNRIRGQQIRGSRQRGRERSRQGSIFD